MKKEKTILIFVMLSFLIFVSSISSSAPVKLATTTDYQATMAIPRWKVFMSESNPQNVWAAFANSCGSTNPNCTNLVATNDSGLTWTALQPDNMTISDFLDGHFSLSGNDNGDIFFTFPKYVSENYNVMFRKFSSPAVVNTSISAETAIHRTTNNNPNPRSSILAISNNTWIFSRSGNETDNVRYNASSDAGLTWTSSGNVTVTNETNIRIGSVPYVNNSPSVVIWYNQKGFKYFLWNSTTSNFTENADSIIYWPNNTDRYFSINTIYYNNEYYFHFVNEVTNGSGTKIMHRWKPYLGGAGTWNETTIDTHSNMSTLGDWRPLLTKRGSELYVFYSKRDNNSDNRSQLNIYYKQWNQSTETWSNSTQVTTDSFMNRDQNVPMSINLSSPYIPLVYTKKGDLTTYFNCNSTYPCDIMFLNVSIVSQQTQDSNLTGCQDLNRTDITYSLISNVESNETCFSILANNVTLDCKGFMINYSASSQGYGINNTGAYNNTLIKNCVIYKTNVTFNNSHAIYSTNSINTTVLNNSIFTIGINLVTVNNYGIYLSSSINSTASSNIIRNNCSNCDGIRFDAGTNQSRIQNNLINVSGITSNAIMIATGSCSNIIDNNSVRVQGTSYSKGIELINTGTRYNNVTNSTGVCELSGSDGLFAISNGATYNIFDTANGLIQNGGSCNGIYVVSGGSLISHNNSFNRINITSFVNANLGLVDFYGDVGGNTSVYDSFFFENNSFNAFAVRLEGIHTTFPVINLINVTFNKSDINIAAGINSSLLLKWFLNVQINDSVTNSSINSANITSQNISNSVISSVLTDSNGRAKVELIEFFQNSTDKTYHTPHNISITKTNYYANNTIYNLTSFNNVYHEVKLISSSDSTPPTISIVSPSNTTYTSSNISVNITSNENLTFCQYSINGAQNISMNKGNETNYFAYNISSDGSKNTIISCNDTSDVWGASSLVHFSIDTANPTVTMLAPANITYNSNNVSINITANEYITGCFFSINGAANLSMTRANETNYYFYNVTSDGSKNVIVACNDTSNLYGSSSLLHFHIDTTKPTISIVSPSNTTYTSSTLNLNVSLDENSSWCSFSLDHAANVSMTKLNDTYFNYTKSGLNEGSHNMTFSCNDTNGNTANSSFRYFSIDSSSPLLIIITPINNSVYKNQTVTIRLNKSEGTAWFTFNHSTNYSYTNPSSINLSEGSHTLYIFINDSAGNLNSTSLGITINTSLTLSNISLNNNQKEVLVYDLLDNSLISVPSTVSNATLNLSGLTNITSQNLTANIQKNITVTSNTSQLYITITIPSQINITGNISNWTGIISLPVMISNMTLNATADSGKTASVVYIVEIGDEDSNLYLDKAVRISFLAQTGKYLGYLNSGSFTKISSTCSSDSQETGDSLTYGQDCKIESDSSLVVWTKHLTRFVIYSQSNTPSSDAGSPGGGGGGSTTTNTTANQTNITVHSNNTNKQSSKNASSTNETKAIAQNNQSSDSKDDNDSKQKSSSSLSRSIILALILVIIVSTIVIILVKKIKIKKFKNNVSNYEFQGIIKNSISQPSNQ